MAGREFSGFLYSMPEMFDGAHMIIIPPPEIPLPELDFVKTLFLSLGFGDVIITDCKNHDKMIAYTSQLAHVVSNADVKRPSSRTHVGFTAGSFKDLTRVARLNEKMWGELFMCNRENLIWEIDNIMNNLAMYRDALATGNLNELEQLLKEGTLIKEEVDPL